MPAGELSGLFNHVTRTATVREFVFGEYQLSNFYGGNVRRTKSGDLAEWDILKADRDRAKISQPGAPSHRVALRPAGKQMARCVHSPEHVMLDGDYLENLRALGQDDANAELYIAQEQQKLADRQAALKEWLFSQMLTGSAVFTQDDAKITINYRMASGHKPTASASWATSTTDIPADIRTWKALIRQDSGREPAHAWCNETVMGYLMANDNVKDLLGDGAYKAQVGRQGRITEFMGLTWHVYDNGYVPSGGSFTKYIADDKLFITPEAGDWVAVQEGSTQIKPLGATQLLRVWGRHSWVELESDPAGYKLGVGDVFLPVLPVPDAIVYADVTP